MAVKEQPEEGKMETQAETVKEEKTVEAEANVKHSFKDYEFRGWSAGVPVPEGWERCPEYENVIRQLKPQPLKSEPLPTPAPAPDKKAESSCNSCEEEPAHRGGGCCKSDMIAVRFDNQT